MFGDCPVEGFANPWECGHHLPANIFPWQSLLGLGTSRKTARNGTFLLLGQTLGSGFLVMGNLERGRGLVGDVLL